MIIGLDVGGTHTDAVLLDDGGIVRFAKVKTDPKDLFRSVLCGLQQATDGIDPAAITRIVLSTTLTTNAIVQNDIAPVGIIVCAGPGINPALFRTHENYHIVAGCMDHRGRETMPLNDKEIRDVGDRLKAAGIQYVGVIGKYSVRNPAHEDTIGRMLKDDFEKIFLGHRISGNLNFPRRIATTYLNAAVYPMHRDFFEAVKRSLKSRGLTAPLRILKADGGNVNFNASIDYPAQTILSGPSASVMGARAFSDRPGDKLVLDIGGTTTDMALLAEDVPLLNPWGIEIGGYKTLIRALDTRSIGVGGDSKVSVTDGRLTVGPGRMGPAMGYGGPAPTPTDALIVLGKIGTGDRERSRAGLAPIAEALNKSIDSAAETIFETTCRKILDEANAFIEDTNAKPVYTVHEMLDGFTVKPKTAYILGGPAPYFAEGFGKLSDIDFRTVPRWEVANAIGAALARSTSEVSLFADTELGIATAPEENFMKPVSASFTLPDAEQMALQLLEKKAVERGANPERLEMETTEALSFNMVKGFYATGKNIRVKVQVKPGLIPGFGAVTAAEWTKMTC